MNKLHDLSKGGWHPKNDKRPSLRGDFKGVNQVAGYFGKGKEISTGPDMREHSAAPLSTLKDPSTFGPPPKHVNYHGEQAVQASRTAAPSSATTRSSTVLRPAPKPAPGGLGTPLPPSQIQGPQEEEPEKPAPPPVPYRANTTGLRTDGLPKPPVRCIDPQDEFAAPRPVPTKPKPMPRLPPRQNSHPDTYAPAPPPTYEAAQQDEPAHEGYLNQGSLSRLTQAGVNVPGFNIGNNAPPQSSRPTLPPTQNGPSSGQLSELQQRFARMNSNTSSTSSPTLSSSGTWTPKQDASRSGWNKANAASNALGTRPGVAGKKAPPPPPKKSGLTADTFDSGSPPPIPHASKPK